MLCEKVLETISKYNLINRGETVVVAVSGGPDSICLLHILHKISQNLDIKLYVAHLNHQIRGLDAYLDSLYVMKFCEKLGVTCFIRSIDVPAFCEENKLGIEEGARKLRYEMFDEIKNKVGADKVAIGHNKSDQAETIIMRIMRGTGLQGLRGIEYKREDGVIRPILDLSREEIEKYCEEHNLSPRIDKTNLDDIYSRNKIRLKMIPYMKKEFNDNVVDNIVRMSSNLKVDSDYINEQVENAFSYSVKKYEDGVYIFTEYMDKFHLAIQNRLIFKSIKEILGDIKLIDKKHIEDVLSLVSKDKKGKKINLPRGVFAYRFDDYILLTDKEIKDKDISYEYEVTPGEAIYIPEIKKRFVSEIVDVKNFDKNNFKKDIQYIDLSKIRNNLTLRNKRQGDKIRLLGGTKKLKELFIGLKIPKENRNLVPVLVNQDEIVSVCGYRINVDYKIGDSTSEILKFYLE